MASAGTMSGDDDAIPFMIREKKRPIIKMIKKDKKSCYTVGI